MRVFVNLKRFHIPKELGGISKIENPKEWVENIIEKSIELQLGKVENCDIVFLLPEGFIISAWEKLKSYNHSERKNIYIGCQGGYREDVSVGGNFGAFTANLPATAIKNLGCTWTIIAHPEEKKDKLGILKAYDMNIETEFSSYRKAMSTVNKLIHQEVVCALKQGVNVLLCVGETAEEKGTGQEQEQKERVKAVIEEQIGEYLDGIEAYEVNGEFVIAYEPVWAIGPGKVPPEKEYIEFVSSHIKEVFKKKYNFVPSVVYGGGLKKENVVDISKIPTIDGGLVALTQFTGDIDFEPEGLKEIIESYIKNER